MVVCAVRVEDGSEGFEVRLVCCVLVIFDFFALMRPSTKAWAGVRTKILDLFSFQLCERMPPQLLR